MTTKTFELGMVSLSLLTAFSMNLSATDLSLNNTNSILDLSIEELMNITVTTASKSDQKITDATSVMTVITKREIESSGARNLNELIKRVPGFFTSRTPTWPLFASRGVISDGNDHFLLLMDGHQQNSILGQGSSTQDVIPNLDRVEKIEIIRGPGSVLWGSSAVMGIINIITKNGEDAKSSVRVGYSDEDKLFYQTGSRVLKGDGYSGYLYANHWSASGYFDHDKKGRNRDDWNRALPIRTTVGDNNKPNFDRQYDSYDISAHFAVGESAKIMGRYLDQSYQYFWDSYDGLNGGLDSELRLRKAYLSYSDSKKIAPKITLDYTLFGDSMVQNRWVRNKNGKDNNGDNSWNTPDHTGDLAVHKRVQDVSEEESAFGGEFLANIKIIETNNLKIGAKYVTTKAGPNRDSKINLENNYAPNGSDNSNTAGTGRVSYIGIDNATDRVTAFYFEDTQQIDKWTLFTGARLDHNNWREKGSVFLPRGGAIYKLDSEWTGKYVINTGYLRPNAKYSKTRGAIAAQSSGDALTVKNSEKILAHDFQISHATDKSFYAVTAYMMDIDNFISFRAYGSQGYMNMGKLRTMGVEVEGKQNIPTSRGDFLVYGNYSYAHSRLMNKYLMRSQSLYGANVDRDGHPLNVPYHIVNLGSDFRLKQHHIFNLHANALLDMKINYGGNNIGDTWRPYNGKEEYKRIYRYFLDAAYTYQGFLSQNMTGKLYINNLLDNTEPLGMAINNGYYTPQGRTLGADLSYAF